MNNIFRQQLVSLRQRQSLSQAALAQKLFVSRQSVSKWELGEAEPDIDKLLKIADVFSVDLNFLLAGLYSPNQSILHISHLVKKFNHPLLQDVSFDISHNERVALLGDNGAGKTTLVNLIMGIIQPDQGEIKRLFDLHHDLGVMTQDNNLLESLTVGEQVDLMAAIDGVNDPSYTAGMLQKFKLASYRQNLVGKLSGGQKRRLSLLLSLLKKTKLLILDEPTVGMDLKSIDFFWSYLDHINSSVLMITHDFNQIDKFFTKVMLLKDGQIITASVADVHANNQTIEQWYRRRTEVTT
ncbi:XRE family transcriptional regulator [Convivina praedatoris]|uniref:Vitamin B12 import ATP-binding protein BtuD n=1 Tax=Convivina praedatoris TaxID=2880963 RepID=A0ABN8HCG6_9LACO|nr:ATP-binding cassette domain-containing protein [Convivina sp. LMG 32447]CAH1851864.1 Vitamin B12 import ATP-binding protein BtuD [Convivina sp. LMG 32447]CAH1851897.1 Vitamin B12 import ATP-binding protein BtuD [Convivina sp. LMG 32447]CAH1852995.1 Vitamin B12 import ATP-binding protein BtuD [Convivina sp. LMG 32447]